MATIVKNEEEMELIESCERGQEGKPAGEKNLWAGNPHKTRLVA